MREDTRYPIQSVTEVAERTFALRFLAPRIARAVRPGQFVNILTSPSVEPLLRRPYSISDVVGDECEILFSLVGKGTNHLSCKCADDMLDVLGPLGNVFTPPDEHVTAVVLAGGIGVAPFRLLARSLRAAGVHTESFVAARNAARLFTAGLDNVHIATDDGSAGYHGTIVACFRDWLKTREHGRLKIYACGPTPMLVATQKFALEHDIACELSLESEMACGIGICQGCPIEHLDHPRKYALVCTDGPCFDARAIRFRDREGG